SHTPVSCGTRPHHSWSTSTPGPLPEAGIESQPSAMSPLLAKVTVSPMTMEPKKASASALVSRPGMAQNPNPLVSITSYAGVTRTLDDWATVFNLATVVLPYRPEPARFVPTVDPISAT